METEIKGKEYTITASQANVKGMILMLPILAGCLAPYILTHGLPETGFSRIYVFIAFLAGVVIHELIHGLCWGMAAKNGFKSIKFGVIWKALTPYCHCREALTIRQYRIGGIMPTIILGFIPVLYSWITGNSYTLMFGTLLVIGGAGDFIVLWMMRKLPGDTMVKDHPKKVGFYIPDEI